MLTQSSMSELSAQALEEFRKAASAPMPPELAKSITQSTGLVAYDLQVPSKNLFPVLTPLRNRIPRVSGNGGTATNWIAVTGINTAALRGFVPEGKRNGSSTTTVVPKSATYKALGLDDSVSDEATLAAKGLEDIRATTAQRLLWATMIEEELAILGANCNVALGTPTAPTVTIVDGGGTIADDAGGYNVYVVALTLWGYLASSLTAGVAQLTSVTNLAGNTFSYGAGSSLPSAAGASGAVSVGGDAILRAYTPVVPGAVAYAWYLGAHDGSATLQAITLINSVSMLAQATTHQNVSAIIADKSQNAYAYDGILYQAWASGSGSYIHNMATGTPGTGTGLTADAIGGITEINDLFRSLWDNYRLSPSHILVNAQEADNITKKVLGATSAHVNYVQGEQGATGGVRVKALLNRFALGVSPEVPVEIHPFLTPGTLLAVTEQLPYPINNVPNVMEVRYRQDYYQIEWPRRERQYETGVYCDSVFAHYFPPSVGIITNIANA
jgi:hypothetical protein